MLAGALILGMAVHDAFAASQTVARAPECPLNGTRVVTFAQSLDGGVFTTTDALRALREVLTGKTAERAVRPTHADPPRRERNTLHQHMRVSDSLRAHGITDRLGKFPG